MDNCRKLVKYPTLSTIIFKILIISRLVYVTKFNNAIIKTKYIHYICMWYIYISKVVQTVVTSKTVKCIIHDHYA